MDYEQQLINLILNDAWRMKVLKVASELDLPDWWVGAGFVRNKVWDNLCNKKKQTPPTDIDVIYFDNKNTSKQKDLEYQNILKAKMSELDWEVVNQARMNNYNDNQQRPYTDSLDAMSFWPETATAVAVKLDIDGKLVVGAPWGLEDLFEGIIRPTENFRGDLYPVFEKRHTSKNWLQKWPGLRVEKS